MFYRVKKEYLDSWSIDGEEEVIVSGDEIKSLSVGWGVSISQLKKQVERLVPDHPDITRYEIGDYIMEAEELWDSIGGHMFDFWLYRKGYGVKLEMFGWPVNQPNAKDGHTVYTKEECVELALSSVSDYIKTYREEYEDDF